MHFWFPFTIDKIQRQADWDLYCISLKTRRITKGDSPAGNSVSSYMCGRYLVSESERFQSCASNVLNGVAGNIGEREELWRERAGQQGIEGEKTGRGKLFFFPSLTPIRFKSSPPSENVPLVLRTLWLGKKECPTRVRRHRVACGAG